MWVTSSSRVWALYWSGLAPIWSIPLSLIFFFSFINLSVSFNHHTYFYWFVLGVPKSSSSAMCIHFIWRYSCSVLHLCCCTSLNLVANLNCVDLIFRLSRLHFFSCSNFLLLHSPYCSGGLHTSLIFLWQPNYGLTHITVYDMPLSLKFRAVLLNHVVYYRVQVFGSLDSSIFMYFFMRKKSIFYFSFAFHKVATVARHCP